MITVTYRGTCDRCGESDDSSWLSEEEAVERFSRIGDELVCWDCEHGV